MGLSLPWHDLSAEMLFSVPTHSIRQRDRLKLLRKAGVGVTGGIMVGVGITLIPLPGLIIVGGVALLATKFPAAQKVLDDKRDKVADLCRDEKQGEEKSSLQYEDELTETTMETIKTGARWVGKQILPVLDHFATNNEINTVDNADVSSTYNLSPIQKNSTIIVDDDVIDSSGNIHWM